SSLGLASGFHQYFDAGGTEPSTMRILCDQAISHMAMMLFLLSCAVIGPVLCAMSLVPAMMCTTRGLSWITSWYMRTSNCGVVCALMPRPMMPFEKNPGSEL